MNNGDSVRQAEVRYTTKPDACEDIGQVLGGWKQTNGFGKVSVGLAGSGKKLTHLRHYRKRIKVIE